MWIYWEKSNSWKAFSEFFFEVSDYMKAWIGPGDHCTDALRLSKSNSESRMEVVNWPLDDPGLPLLASGESHARVPTMCVRDKWCFTDVCRASSLVVYTAKAFSVLVSTSSGQPGLTLKPFSGDTEWKTFAFADFLSWNSSPQSLAYILAAMSNTPTLMTTLFWSKRLLND